MKTTVVTRNPRELTLLDVNARFMRHEQFATLVENVRRDGVLTSVPLVHADGGREVVLSGNHRVKAAVAAGLEEVQVMLVEEPLTRQQAVALQLSHNAITGEDDPATLKRLYEELDDVDWRTYSGLDDRTLALLDQVDVSGLSEANLDFATVTLVFLPSEKERAEAAMEEVARAGSGGMWVARLSDYEPMLEALLSVKNAYRIGNVATALMLLIDVVERHIGDLRDGWYDAERDEPRHAREVPVESLVGARFLPAEQAAVVARALDRIAEQAELDSGRSVRALELLAAEHLAGPS